MVRIQQIMNWSEAGHIRTCHRSALSQSLLLPDPPCGFFRAQICVSSFMENIMLFSWRDTRKEQTKRILWARPWPNLYVLWWRKAEGISVKGDQRRSMYCSPRSRRSKGWSCGYSSGGSLSKTVRSGKLWDPEKRFSYLPRLRSCFFLPLGAAELQDNGL